ncbi:hypothetical protein CSA17_02405 [bacterium DOLJORAL78_65_58]|nr:MAG: hypothetical protein CSB20_06735 [bacterium DOLZORAL124_64_63]PIE76408.1 MAG: hypothetical protein CSA17_02405 [bacterium DOLJORAL78_65_58]
MKSRVAILEARPETIADDYHRLLKLAGLLPPDSLPWDLLACVQEGRSWQPGRSCPPWQVRGMAEALADGAGLLAVGAQGSMAAADRLRALLASEERETKEIVTWAGAALETVPYRAVRPLPALEGSLEAGLELSPHLRDRRPLLLTPVSLAEGGRLQAAVSALADWLAPKRRRRGRIPESEVLAEVLGLARELFTGLGVVCDATVLGLRRRGGARVSLDRNLLVAGADPVAVDAVLARLLGLRLESLPWLRLAQRRGVGNSEVSRIEVLGDGHLTDLDFQIPADSFAAGQRGWLSRRLPAVLARGAEAADRDAGDSPWQGLHNDFQTGAVS